MISKIKEKKIWILPLIKMIELDNEITLQLASDREPMGEPNWIKANQHSTNDPYKMG